MKTTKEMIEVMQAHLDGKKIEVMYVGDVNSKFIWEPCKEQPWQWSWDYYHYRIKPETKKRPIRPDELPYVFVLKYKNGQKYACEREFFSVSIEYAIKNGGMWTTDGNTYHSFEVEE